jgi:glutaconate CoA-transferase subunit A
LEKFGLARNYRRAVEQGRVEVVDYPEMASWDRFRANQEGLAFWPVGFLGGNDVMKYNERVRPFACPISGRPMQALPAANPDVVVIHAIAADEDGNVVFPAHRLLPQNGDVLMGRASENVIVTVEKVVSKAFIRRHARITELPSYRTKAIVEVPWGAHPTPALSRYLADEDHMAEYAEAGASAETFDVYLRRYVYEPGDHFAYLERVGAARLARLADIGSLL